MTRRRGEFEIVSELLSPLGGGDPRALGFGDDAALLPPRPGRETVVSTDTMVAGIHFPAHEAPELVARKLLRVNLSDLAAMGARPDAYFLNLALPDDVTDAWLEGFAEGLRADQEIFAAVLLGGDVTSSGGPLALSATILGDVPEGRAVTRAGAAPGEPVMVSGTIGDAALGLAALRDGAGGPRTAEREFLIRRYRLPEPRLALGQALAGIATAMADVSDGLAADLAHVCKASGTGARIALAAVPVSPAARAAGADARTLVTGGDDYELVFSVRPEDRGKASAAAAAAGTEISEIGTIAAAEGGILAIGTDGEAVDVGPGGWRHLRPPQGHASPDRVD